MELSAAGKDSCRFCGVKFTTYEEKISLNRMHGRIQNCLYHKSCFRCTVCHRQLSVQNYFLSSSKYFYCILHCDFENGYNNCGMSRQLKAFKGYSKDRLSAILHNASPFASPRENIPTFNFSKKNGENSTKNQLYCFCRSNDIIVPTEGFWIECITKECKENNCIRQKNIMIIRDFPHKIADQPFELEQYNEEVYEISFEGTEHHNYYCVDDDLKPVILSLKQDLLKDKEYFRILVRSSSHIIEGLLPTSCICANKYSEIEVVDALRRELKLTDHFKPFLDEQTEEKLCKLDRIMHKSEFKVGLLFIKDGQETEEEFFTNTEHTPDFEEFLGIVGDKIQLKGFTGFSGGLDTHFDLTGERAVFTRWNDSQFMFHVSTMLPTDENDDQKLQRKRHIGNDIVCLVFLSSPRANFRPNAIKSNFLHVYIVIRPLSNNNSNSLKQYEVAVISRALVLPFGPPLPGNGCFTKGEDFRNWLMTKIVNGERASYRSPKFATMQERTRRQMLDELISEEINNEHLMMKPKDKNSHSPLQKFFHQSKSNGSSKSNGRAPHDIGNKKSPHFPDWLNQTFDDSEQLQKDLMSSLNGIINQSYDVCFIVGIVNQKSLPAVKAILAARSRIFHEMFYEKQESNSAKSTPNSSPKIGRKQALGKSTSSPTMTSGLKKKLSLERLKKRSHSFKNCEEDITLRPTVTEYLVTEFEPEEFSLFLEYLHNGLCIIYPEVLPSLLCIADHYEVDALVKSCLESFEDLATPSSICPMLVCTRKFTRGYMIAQELQLKILRYIEKHSLEVLRSFDVAALSEDCLSLVLSLNLKAREIDKLQIVNSWLERNFTDGIHGNDFLIRDSFSCLINIADIGLDDLSQIYERAVKEQNNTSSVTKRKYSSELRSDVLEIKEIGLYTVDDFEREMKRRSKTV